ncbi:MAG TPA: tRNA (guanosine(37)-N1)-methyltransferase TrmD [Candidatus Anoxymicrobiaceae bacterium]
MTLEAHVFCTLPEMLVSPLSAGVLGRAVEAGALDANVHSLHSLSPDPHHKADDTPYGGGPGMVLRVDVVAAALEAVFDKDAATLRQDFPVILLTPQGERFDQAIARELAREQTVVFICGRYEGVDERIRRHIAGREISLGDFVLAGGEIAACAVLEAVVRLLPGVLGNEESLAEESFAAGLLEYPQYTRPAEFRGWRVPDVLTSGDHGRIKAFREEQALERTRERRPDLL